MDFLASDEKFKFIDDLSVVEVINLISIGLACYNTRSHVPSDIATDNLYLDSANIKSQEYLDNISDWTGKQEMKLNTDKTKYMLFNYSTKYQFNTRQTLEGGKIDQTHQTKLLGLVLRDDLSWKSNTKELSKRAYSRMLIIKKLYQFDVPVEELINIYILYIRSVVEQSAVVWHSSITKGEQRDLERTQKVALRIILKDSYTSYPEALKLSGLDTLSERRSKLCLNFAKKCTKSEKTSEMFPLNKKVVNTRHHEQFNVTHARTDRLAKSAIPYMQRLLNANSKKK